MGLTHLGSEASIIYYNEYLEAFEKKSDNSEKNIKGGYKEKWVNSVPITFLTHFFDSFSSIAQRHTHTPILRLIKHEYRIKMNCFEIQQYNLNI